MQPPPPRAMLHVTAKTFDQIMRLVDPWVRAWKEAYFELAPSDREEEERRAMLEDDPVQQAIDEEKEELQRCRRRRRMTPFSWDFVQLGSRPSRDH